MSHFASVLNQRLAEAVDLFIMTKFDQCFKVCNSVINTAKCEPEKERISDIIEAATALGIQALAETDKWHHVIAFTTEVYGTIALCPPRIIQTCILLHAHVKEYLPCHNLVQTWLKNPCNLNNEKCPQVIRVYAHHILCPTGSYDTLREIVHGCKSLTETERATLLQFPQTGRYEEAKKVGSTISNSGGHVDKNAHDGSRCLEHSQIAYVSRRWNIRTKHMSSDQQTNLAFKESKPADKSTLQTICTHLYHYKLTIWRYLQNKGFRLIIMGIFAVWALMHTQTGDPVSSLGWLVILWRAFLQKLNQFIVKK